MGLQTSINIAIIGSGYVGMSLATLLSQKHKVTILDINKEKINMINSGISPIRDSMISDFLKHKELDLQATCSLNEAIETSDIAIIATPTDYNDLTNKFDTRSVDATIEKIIKINKKIPIIIKSTIPQGYTSFLRKKHNYEKIFFSPEFLREGYALHDNLYPSRIIIGSKCNDAKIFARILKEASLKPDVDILFTSSDEAEAIKLFSNSFLALRVAFFNELDTYAMSKNISSFEIIRGLGLDKRIGDHYNNPSFGYGGYCLPKDTKQLLANFGDIPQDLIKSVIESNKKRKEFIATKILETNSKTIGFYRLTMKKNSDNFRSSSILDIINLVKQSDRRLIIYEPFLAKDSIDGIEVEKDLENFKIRSDLIVTNRLEDSLQNVIEKVFTRDLFKNN